jgi:predicted HicB family RNase H-like nuclease
MSGSWVYIMKHQDRYKIGFSSYPKIRRIQISISLPDELSVVALAWYPNTFDARNGEKNWHRTFSSKRIKGEWFKLNPQDIEDFRSLAIRGPDEDESGILNVRVSPEIIRRAKSFAEREGRTLRWVVEQALSRYLEAAKSKLDMMTTG